MEEQWSKKFNIRQLAASLQDMKIEKALVTEKNSTCVLQLWLDDGRLIEVGVSGNLYDEAYFVFKRI
jgi:hypothetical protein